MLACSLRRRNIYTISTGSDKVKAVHDWPRPKIEKSEPPDFPKTVGPSVLTDRNAVGLTISKYILDRMSGKT